MMDKINILHLRSSGGFFGAEGVILNLGKELEKLGFNNYITCLNNVKNPHTELLERTENFGLKSEAVLCAGRLDLKAIFKIRQLLKKHRIHILHCHDYKANFFGFFACRFLKIKLVTTNHGWTKETLALRFYEFLDGILINFFNKVVAVSDKAAKELCMLCVSKRKIITIYNGIDLSKYSLNSDGQKIKKEFNIHPTSKVVGSIGRLSSEKGFDYFLEAAKRVLDKISQVTFLIVGNGILKEQLEKKAEKLEIKDRIIFTGKRTDMIDIYNCIDVFVLPSIREGLPLVVLEALAMKKPVIATNVGGVPVLIHSNKTGILLKPKDVQGLSSAITELLFDTNKAEFLALNGRKLVEENFSAERMAGEYKKVYEELII